MAITICSTSLTSGRMVYCGVGGRGVAPLK